jgi:hypothetical protein
MRGSGAAILRLNSTRTTPHPSYRSVAQRRACGRNDSMLCCMFVNKVKRQPRRMRVQGHHCAGNSVSCSRQASGARPGLPFPRRRSTRLLPCPRTRSGRWTGYRAFAGEKNRTHGKADLVCCGPNNPGRFSTGKATRGSEDPERLSWHSLTQTGTDGILRV